MQLKFYAILLLATCCLIAGLSLADDQPTSTEPVAPKSARGRFHLPAVFNFARFKVFFNKHYGTVVEELRRQKLFLVKTFKVFMHNMRFKRGEKDTYLKLNQLSDRTSEEISRRYMGPESMKTIPGDFEATSRLTSASKIASRRRRSIETVQDSSDNQIFVDHRNSECLTPIKDQGDCGSCYIFATTALLEWHYCKLTGRQEHFSEQYTIDCGYRYGLDGCAGGMGYSVLSFYQRYGLELSASYPYQSKGTDCPYWYTKPREEMGYIRIDDVKEHHVPLENYDEELVKGPITVAIRLNNDFADYGGGIDSLHGCNSQMRHEMLIVGSGRQEGKDYWIIKNSYSSFWGEDGYYRLAKSATDCIIDHISRALDQDSFSTVKMNPLYDPSALKKYYVKQGPGL